MKASLPGERLEEAAQRFETLRANFPLITVPVKFPASMVAAIDAKTKNRSDFIRKAVAASL